MKRILSTILLCVTALCAYSQEDITLFFLNDGTFKGFYDEEIDSITYSHLDLDSVWHADAVVQDVWLADSVVRIPIEKIDSICHKVPEPEYKPGVIHLDERYLPFITSVNGLTLSFSSDLPENLWPKEGDVLLYEGSNDIFPNGFAGNVTKLVDGVAVCDSASVDDVYERLYFFGSYVLAEDGKNTGTYSARKICSRHADGKWEDWGIFEVNPTDIPFDKIKIAEKIDISKANMFAAISGTIIPTVTVEASYVFNVYEPLIFFKATHRFEYDALLQVGFRKDFTPTHHKDIGKPFKMHKLDENRDEKGFHLYFINECVPLPQCPILNVGFKMGLFIDPKIEAEAVLGLHIQASEDKTHIYKLDKNNIGRLGDWWKGDGPEPETSSCEVELEGSLTGSVWAGLMAAINVGVGTDKSGMKEELSARIGPYIEGKLNLDILDLNKEMSWYSGLKDSKIKRGIKSEFNLDFTAKMPKVFSYKWTQLELSPPKLLFEQDCYLLPAFKAPTYSVHGNSLKCYTSVTRSTVPNHIGLRVKDESGNEVTKWHNFTFDFADEDNPYVISETFDNLDFANHRYTIIPVTRIWKLPALEIPEPSQTCVTCPDSHHPHLIDLGLPSGTKWLCSNLYAEDPKDAGGYYQWGKPYMVHAYTDLTYNAPHFTMANYQNSEYDAATANLGQEYCTPTMSQFLELHDNCSMDYKYSPWGNNVLGVFLKGKNGNNLYLPFSGFKSGVKVNNSSEGWFLSSDAVDSNNNLQRKAVVFKNADAIWGSADALAYGHSVRPVSSHNDGLVFEPQQLDYEVYVGQKVGQSVTVTNNGSAAVSVTVAQTGAPFQVDDACLGTFTVTPKERLSVLVYFSPTEEKEYTSALTLSYETGNTCVVSKVPLKGKGYSQSNLTCPDDHHPHMIDMGLPSGTKWACCNVGATTPEEYGDYFAWGETKSNWDTYFDSSFEKYNNEGGLTELLPEDDAATVNWGAPWRMPTLSQQQELWDNCSSEWTQQNGVNGRLVTGPNGGQIFLPAAGYRWDGGLYYAGGDGVYWSSSLYPHYDYDAFYLYFDSNGWDWYRDNRYYGLSVRAVRVKDTPPVKLVTSIELSETSLTLDLGESKTLTATVLPEDADNRTLIWSSSDEAVATVNGVGLVTAVAKGSCTITCSANDGSGVYAECQVTVTQSGGGTSYLTCPDGHHPHIIDLGLPSGTKWACCNVGATTPEGYGDYFAWGETKPKDVYNSNTYFDSSREKYNNNGGLTELLPEDDAATANWGAPWRMPTISQQQELLDNCSSEWTQQNGVNGRLVTSPNGGRVFLPAAGYRWAYGLDDAGSYGFYWSSSLGPYDDDYAYSLYFYSGNCRWYSRSRYDGRSVRAVRP